MSIDHLGKLNIHNGGLVLRIFVILDFNFFLCPFLTFTRAESGESLPLRAQDRWNDTYKYLTFSHAKTFISHLLGGKTCLVYTDTITIIFSELILLKHKYIVCGSRFKTGSITSVMRGSCTFTVRQWERKRQFSAAGGSAERGPSLPLVPGCPLPLPWLACPSVNSAHCLFFRCVYS